MQHLIHHNILHSHQRAYFPTRSTATTLARINNIVQLLLLDILDNDISTIVVFLDLSAAFDTLNHSIMINRLANTGFTGKAVHLLPSYITDKNPSGTICSPMISTGTDSM